MVAGFVFYDAFVNIEYIEAYLLTYLKVFYRPRYEREIWHYQRANVDQIQQAIKQFSWEKLFRNLNINEMFSLFNKTIKNILSNYIPHEKITYDGKNPPWFNKNIKQLVQEKNSTYKSHILSDKNPQIFERVKSPRTSSNVQLNVTKKSIICVHPKNCWIQPLVQKLTGQY